MNWDENGFSYRETYELQNGEWRSIKILTLSAIAFYLHRKFSAAHKSEISSGHSYFSPALRNVGHLFQSQQPYSASESEWFSELLNLSLRGLKLQVICCSPSKRKTTYRQLQTDSKFFSMQKMLNNIRTDHECSRIYPYTYVVNAQSFPQVEASLRMQKLRNSISSPFHWHFLRFQFAQYVAMRFGGPDPKCNWSEEGLRKK